MIHYRYYKLILDEYINAIGLNYDVVERTEMNKILGEHEFSSCVSDSCALELGRILSADRIILGSVGKIGETYTVSARMIDVNTAKTLGTASSDYRGDIDEVLNSVLKKVADELMYGDLFVEKVVIKKETTEAKKTIKENISGKTAFLEITPWIGYLRPFNSIDYRSDSSGLDNSIISGFNLSYFINNNWNIAIKTGYVFKTEIFSFIDSTYPE